MIIMSINFPPGFSGCRALWYAIRSGPRVELVMWSESPGNALLGLSDTIGLDGPIVRLIDFIYRHRKKKWRQFLIVPGVQDMLARLKGHYPMVIVSARDEDSTMDFLKELIW